MPYDFDEMWASASDEELKKAGLRLDSMKQGARAAILAELDRRNLAEAIPDALRQQVGEQVATIDPFHDDPLYGVKGWLKAVVIGNMYVGPVLIALQLIFAWVGFIWFAGEHPGIVLVGLVATVPEVIFAYLGVEAARGLRDIKPGAVQEMTRLIKLRFGWTLVSAPLFLFGWSLSGLDPSALVPETTKEVVRGSIGCVVGLMYFNVSKRVRATYPDWASHA